MSIQQTPIKAKRDEYHEYIKSQHLTSMRKNIREANLKTQKKAQKQNRFKQICSNLDLNSFNQQQLDNLINLINNEQFVLTEKLCKHLIPIIQQQLKKINSFKVILQAVEISQKENLQKTKGSAQQSLIRFLQTVVNKSFKDLERHSHDDPIILNFSLKLITNQNKSIKRLSLEWIFILALNLHSKQHYLDTKVLKSIINLQNNQQYDNCIQGIIGVLFDYENVKVSSQIIIDLIELFKTRKTLFTVLQNDRLQLLQRIISDLTQNIQTKSKISIVNNTDYQSLLIILLQKTKSLQFDQNANQQYPNYSIYKFSHILAMVSNSLSRIYQITPQIIKTVEHYNNKLVQLNKQFNFFQFNLQSIENSLYDQARDQKQKEFVRYYLQCFLAFLLITDYQKFTQQDIALISYLYQQNIRNVNVRNMCLKLLRRATDYSYHKGLNYQINWTKFIYLYDDQVQILPEIRDPLTQFILDNHINLMKQRVYLQQKNLEQQRIKYISDSERRFEKFQLSIKKARLGIFEQVEEEEEDKLQSN